MKRKYFINSFIVGFLLNGLLINGFCIYTALVFNEGDSLINKVLFLICGILFLIFLFKKSINVIRGLKVGTSKIGNVTWLGEAAPQPECCSVCAQKAPARPGLPWSCPPA